VKKKTNKIGLTNATKEEEEEEKKHAHTFNKNDEQKTEIF